jgi:hypothetical protein
MNIQEINYEELINKVQKSNPKSLLDVYHSVSNILNINHPLIDTDCWKIVHMLFELDPEIRNCWITIDPNWVAKIL